jgi:hypothetical protein
MLDWRIQRQIIIFFIYFLIVFIPVVFISYNLLKKSPSCFDGIQNNQEEGVDCNGSCSLQCVNSYKEIKTNFVRSLAVSENLYDIFALVENYNTDIYFPNVPYTLSFYSDQGKLLGTSTGAMSLYPQSKGVVFIPSLEIMQKPKTIDFQLGEHKALKFTGDFPRNVTVESWQAQRGANNSLQLVGELKNPNNIEYRNISVYALLYDDTRTVYAVSGTKVISLGGRQTTGVTFTWGDIISPRNVEFVVVVEN